ncbi:MAG: prenyltransferase [Acidobacteria bacterium]|nr:prenyltransferase [Acidobacteriota bacterium]
MPDLRFLLKASRPRFWIYIFGPYLIGLIAAVADKRELIDWRILVFGLFFTFPANLLIYGINDIFDYETDKLNPKKAGYEALVTPERRGGLIAAIVITTAPFLLIAATLGLQPIIAFGAFLFYSIFYSAPPIRAKAWPFLDSLFNVLYIMPGVFAFAMLTGDQPPNAVFFAGGLWTAAMHAYSAIPDIDADREAKLSTIATVLGSTGTHLFCLAAYIGSAILTYQYLGKSVIWIGLLYVGIMLVSMISKDKDSVFGIYRRFPLVNAGVGFAIFWYLAISKFYLCFFMPCHPGP